MICSCPPEIIHIEGEINKQVVKVIGQVTSTSLCHWLQLWNDEHMDILVSDEDYPWTYLPGLPRTEVLTIATACLTCEERRSMLSL